MKTMHTLVAALGATLLTACNMVVSNEPMLARGPDTPMMKPGIWVDATKTDCEYDAETSPESWPECADPAIVAEDGKFFTYEEKDKSWRSVNVVLGDGDPTVVQVSMPAEMRQLNPSVPNFLYLALRPTERDAEGYITAISTWLMVCGPTDKKEETQSIDDAVTKEPFDGMTMVDGNCMPDDLAALQNAAAASELLDDEPGGARWLRAADDVELD